MMKMGHIGRTVLVATALLVLPFVLFTGCSKDKSTSSNNRAPVINSITVSPQTVNPGGSATVTVSATDADGDQLTYAYTVTGGTIVGSGATATWTLSTTPGAYTVNVSVSDGDLSASGVGGCAVSQPSTRIVGTLSLAPGQTGDLSNTRIGIYTSLQEWANDTPVRVVAPVGSGATVTYVFDNVVPGNYYFDAWKDIDNDFVIDFADIYGWYGNGSYPNGALTQFPVNQGQTVTISIQMFVL
jgi:hypothetical protein